jgi:tetratricopeptide (TPR) repeat protein
LEKINDQQTHTESTQLVELINSCLRSADYSRALDFLRNASAEFPNDAQLSELEKRAQHGLKCNAEANRLITESQALFAQQKPAEAIQLLREAYELDKKNSLARAILANALVEHAHSFVETDWLEAEKLTNQALAVNPAHPTAKTILSQIVEKKTKSSAEDWASQARKFQSSGDLFAALAWVAEGLAVHPDDPKLQQLQDEIQRDQGARRRQARRQDLDDLRRMATQIDGAADAATKQALGERIQGMAAKYWTDGEILSIANALLLRLGLIPKSSTASPQHGSGAPVIFHVPRPSAPKLSSANISEVPPAQSPAAQISQSEVAPKQVPSSQVPPNPAPLSQAQTGNVPRENVSTAIVTPSTIRASKVAPGKPPSSTVSQDKVPPTPQIPTPQTPPLLVAEPPVPAAKVTSPQPQQKPVKTSNSTTLIVGSAAALVLVAATFFFTRRHYAPPAAKIDAASPGVSAPSAPPPAASSPVPSVSVPEQKTPEPSQPDLPVPSDSSASDTNTAKVTPKNQPPADLVQKVGTLLVVAGQDGAGVVLNGKLQPQLTQSGQLRLPNLEPNDYVVQVLKSGFQDPPPQKIRIRTGQQARLVFNLQPQPTLAWLTIRGAAPGTTVLVDQTPIGTVQPDGTLSVATVKPGDHIVELRKERFKPRQLKKRFVAGETISLTAADAALEIAPAELKITFTPADAKVAISKGELPTMVSSGVPLNVAAGTYTLTARTSDGLSRFSTFEVVAGQSKTLDLSLAPNGMSKWDDPSAWKQEGDSFTRKGGDFVLYEVVPASGNFAFSAMPIKGHLLQWVLNYIDARNYILFQLDDSSFYRVVIHNGVKTDEIKIPDKGDKKHFRAFHIRVGPTEIVHQIRHGDVWTVVDRLTMPGANLSSGKFGFYIPGDEQVALSSFAHYADLNIR